MARNQDFGPRDVRTIKSILDDYVRSRSFVNPRERSARVGRMRYTHFSSGQRRCDAFSGRDANTSSETFGSAGLYSTSCICATLIKRKVTRKALSRIARRQNEIARAAFRRALEGVDPARFIFGDETKKCPRSLERDYGRGDRSKRVKKERDFMRSQRGYSTLAFMTLDGIIANSVPTRATGVNTERFIRDVEMTLLPILRPDSIVIWDNATTHISEEVIDVIKTHMPTCMVLYLPP